ncbi:hypothetical protein [Gluconobacter cadivus]|uniref:Uncharacterized protein n=1 Tax=Gluconobacter cadivus TaxID=2728101 RepID=A0ABR9YS52_9PROT|nr:hypothetical protein [Gluconobacter cadivus]MBF0887351.1 hypothetical protein [Gluconobacter cadivus]MBS1059421.1 hypothetical protein [Gluconobacter sp. Dm-44]
MGFGKIFVEGLQVAENPNRRLFLIIYIWCELRDSNLLLNIFGVLGGSQFQQKTADMMLFSVNIMENKFGEKLKPVKGSIVAAILNVGVRDNPSCRVLNIATS